MTKEIFKIPNSMAILKDVPLRRLIYSVFRIVSKYIGTCERIIPVL